MTRCAVCGSEGVHVVDHFNARGKTGVSLCSPVFSESVLGLESCFKKFSKNPELYKSSERIHALLSEARAALASLPR